MIMHPAQSASLFKTHDAEWCVGQALNRELLPTFPLSSPALCLAASTSNTRRPFSIRQWACSKANTAQPAQTFCKPSLTFRDMTAAQFRALKHMSNFLANGGGNWSNHRGCLDGRLKNDRILRSIVILTSANWRGSGLRAKGSTVARLQLLGTCSRAY